MHADMLRGARRGTRFMSARNRLAPGLAACFVASVLVLSLAIPAAAQTRLEADYRVTLSGFPIGSGSWTIDVAEDRYTMSASGKSGGFLRAFSSGDGSAAIRGLIAGTRATPTNYTMSIRSGGKLDQVQMALAGGAVRSLSVEPPVKPNPKRIPIQEGHKRSIVDPLTAGLAPRAGANGMGPEACSRTTAIFDGRQRYDLALSFKRMDKVRSEKGYEGPVIVCAVAYRPIGGYEAEKFTTKFLRETRDLEIWYAPVEGTKFLAVYRVVVPTALGHAVLQATRFMTTGKGTRATDANTRVR